MHIIATTATKVVPSNINVLSRISNFTGFTLNTYDCVHLYY